MLTAATLPARAAAPGIHSYTGNAYSRDDSRLLYREQHWIYRDDGRPRRLVLYTCPDGKPFARKHLRGSPDSSDPDFDLLDARSGYREGAYKQDGRLHVYVQKNAASARRSKILPLKPGAVIDAGFDAYVHKHWDALGQSDATVPFLLPSHLDYVRIKVGSAADVRENGRAVRTLRMRLAAWYAFAVPAIHLTYSAAGERLMRFEGIGTIRDRHGENQNVRIDFPRTARQQDVPREALQRALTEPLSGRCEA